LPTSPDIVPLYHELARCDQPYLSGDPETIRSLLANALGIQVNAPDDNSFSALAVDRFGVMRRFERSVKSPVIPPVWSGNEYVAQPGATTISAKYWEYDPALGAPPVEPLWSVDTSAFRDTDGWHTETPPGVSPQLVKTFNIPSLRMQVTGRPPSKPQQTTHCDINLAMMSETKDVAFGQVSINTINVSGSYVLEEKGVPVTVVSFSGSFPEATAPAYVPVRTAPHFTNSLNWRELFEEEMGHVGFFAPVLNDDTFTIDPTGASSHLQTIAGPNGNVTYVVWPPSSSFKKDWIQTDPRASNEDWRLRALHALSSVLILDGCISAAETAGWGLLGCAVGVLIDGLTILIQKNIDAKPAPAEIHPVSPPRPLPPPPTPLDPDAPVAPTPPPTPGPLPPFQCAADAECPAGYTCDPMFGQCVLIGSTGA
jgi:hypothetical protein